MTTASHALYGGNVPLHFNPKTHQYKIEGRKVPSVTTILTVLNKPALIGWAVNETVAHLESNWQPDRPYTQAEITGLLQAAKKSRFSTSKTALDVGSTAHLWIERYVQARMRGVTYPPQLPNHTAVRSAVEAFLEWEATHEIEYLHSERKIYSRQYNYCGTVDLVAKVDGRFTVADFKTSKAIYSDYFLQGAAYCQAIEEEDGVQKDDMQIVVLRIPKDGGDFEVGARDNVSEIFDAFRAALDLHNWQSREGG